MLGEARTDAAERAVVHDRREHHAVDAELLDLVKDGLALGDVPLAALLVRKDLARSKDRVNADIATQGSGQPSFERRLLAREQSRA
jgi:hypothetical protein